MRVLYTFWGKVKKGKQRGKDLGFPTANLTLHKKIPEGIYAAKVSIRSIGVKPGIVWYPAATFIGSAKTFGETKVHAESYILDFDQNIYGKWISVTLLKKIRENKKFDSEKTLIEQMKKDISDTKTYFSAV